MSSEVEMKPLLEIAEEVTDIFPDSAVEAAATSSLPASSIPGDSASATTDDVDAETDASSESASSESASSESEPAEMKEWIESIDKIEYHFRTDDSDDNRSFSFFKDAKGNTLKITEFYIGDVPYVNINDNFVISRDNFLSVERIISVNGNKSAILDMDKSPRIVIEGATVKLLAEALMILGEDSDDEDEEVPEPIMNARQQSVVNFLINCATLVFFLKFFGSIIMLMSRH